MFCMGCSPTMRKASVFCIANKSRQGRAGATPGIGFQLVLNWPAKPSFGGAFQREDTVCHSEMQRVRRLQVDDAPQPVGACAPRCTATTVWGGTASRATAFIRHGNAASFYQVWSTARRKNHVRDDTYSLALLIDRIGGVPLRPRCRRRNHSRNRY
jgi:hypothetical protein